MMATPGSDPPASRPDPAGFFDAEYRRLLAPFHPELEARHEAAALRELLGMAQDDRILDLGCGWGRHLSLLAEAGHDIVGVDLSPALLRQVPRARPVTDDVSPVDPPAARPRQPPLAAADMRALPLAERSFDIVLNLATSLGLFLLDDPARAALREARRVLRPGGRLLLEGMHRDDIAARFAPRVRWFLADRTEVRVRRRFDPLRGISEEVLRWRGPRGSGEKRHALRIRSATEIAALLEGAGLAVLHAYGDWDGRALRHTSPRLVLVAGRS
ncbi:MAG TPA: class I SAM-dependent methyltransferase [Longimicrobiales bacterium]|nr:class I SAM-dependent methyltransferase [Longimicrobiales bacterium]